MSEENINDKPKVTLIKHPTESTAKTAPLTSVAASNDATPKKKVVVVKKKEATVKSTVVSATAVKTAEPVKKVVPTAIKPKTVKPAATKKDSSSVVEPKAKSENANSEQPKKEAKVAPKKEDVKSESKPAASTKPTEATKSDAVSRRNYADNISQSNTYDKKRLESQKSRPQPAPRTGAHFVVKGNGDSRENNNQGYRTDRPGFNNRAGGQARSGGYQGGQGGYQGRTGGYQGGQGGQGGYQGRTGGYQGGQGGQGGYQGRSGGYQGGQGRPGGFQGGQGRPGGYQGGQGRPGGYQGGPGRPGGYQGGPGRPGGFQSGPAPDALRDEGQKHRNKRMFKGKTKEDIQKEQEELAFQQDKKKNFTKLTPVPKEVDILDVVSVSELARKMNLKAADLIGKLFSMGVMATINQQIDADTATILASEYDCKVNLVSLYDETIIETEKDEDSDLQHRPPIITVMGHVDHGKTKLLDSIRKANVVAGEAGGITQHIGAYKVNRRGHDLVFLDTPGHSAFSLMRARGAQVTDIVVLVVAANDGVMPQTVEAIHHAQEAKVPIIVAVNKCDLFDANPDRVKQQLSEYGLLSEDWGGTTLYCHISALKNEGIDELLDSILLQAEMMELTANYNTRAEGKVIESRVEQGRGIVSSVVIQRGTLKVGDAYVAGVFYGKVRALFDDNGKKIKEAGPSTPVEIIGLTGIPDAGSPFQVTASEKEAKQVSEKRQELDKVREAKNIKKITLDNLYDKIQDDDIQELKVIVKGDVHGSVEAIKTALEKIKTKEIRINVIHASAGAIIESDVNLASASNAIVVGFNVRPTPKAQEIADKEKVEIRKYQIIYDVIEEMTQALEGMLAPEVVEEVIGKIEVRDTFKVPKVGTIAGCYVLEGYCTRQSRVHVLRDNIVIATAGITSLKRFKDDAKEVKEGFECGMGLDFNDVQVGDIYEVFAMKEIKKKLELVK